jgi:trk system potassium uptake protein TrkA
MRQVAVIGLGHFGLPLVESLIRQGVDVLAVDVSEERVRQLSEDVSQAVQADATDAGALRELGLQGFDAVVVSVGKSVEASITIVMHLAEMGVKHIVAKAVTPLHARALEKLGAHRVIVPERDMALRVAHSLINPDVLDYIELLPDVSIVQVDVPDEFAGRSLKELDLRSRWGISVIAIKRAERDAKPSVLVSPRADLPLRRDDVLVLLGSIEQVESALDKASSAKKE